MVVIHQLVNPMVQRLFLGQLPALVRKRHGCCTGSLLRSGEVPLSVPLTGAWKPEPGPTMSGHGYPGDGPWRWRKLRQ